MANTNTNSELFFKIWHNNYLRNIIFKYLHIFKIHNIESLNINSLPSLNYSITYQHFEFCKSFIIKDIGYLEKIDQRKEISKLCIKDTIYCFNQSKEFINKYIECFNESEIEELSISFNNYIDKFKSDETETEQYLRYKKTNKFNFIHPGYKIERTFLKNLPSKNLKSLTLGLNFTCIEPNILPDTLKILKIYGESIEINEFSIPQSVETLLMDSDFDQELPNENYLPSSLKEIKFGWNYNKPINSLTFKKCKQLESIKFNSKFNYQIKQSWLPISLTSLELTHRFNLKINLNKLINLKIIKFSTDFNQPLFVNKNNDSSNNDNNNNVESILPKNIEEVYFGRYFKQAITIGSIPTSCKKLYFKDSTIDYFDSNAIPNVKILRMPVKIEKINKDFLSNNNKLEEIEYDDFNFSLEQHQHQLPTSIKTITVVSNRNSVFNPQSILNSELNYQFEKVIIKGDVLHQQLFCFQNIKEYHVKYRMYDNINNILLPPNGCLEKLVITGTSDFPFFVDFFENCYNSLKCLEFKDYLSYQIVSLNSLPESLETIIFNDIKSIENISFIRTAKNLKNLVINRIFNNSIERFSYILPKSITSIEIRYSLGFKQINKDWFNGCNNLKEIKIGSSNVNIDFNNLPNSTDTFYIKELNTLFYHQDYFNSKDPLDVFNNFKLLKSDY